MPGTPIDIEEVLSQTRPSDFHIFVADVVKSLIQLTGTFSIVPLVGLVFQLGFRKLFLFPSRCSSWL